MQPVLLELDHVEDAAASLGADNLAVFRLVILPALLPSLLSGAGLAFFRAIGEYGFVVLIGGAVPGETEVSSQYIRQLIDIRRPHRGGGGFHCAAAETEFHPPVHSAHHRVARRPSV